MQALRRIAPKIPKGDFKAVVDQALHSRGLKTASAESAAWLSLVSYARHNYTGYDAARDDGYDRDAARFFILDDLNRVLGQWGVSRKISAED
ncbi:MAG: DUF2293 domain-containing protein [Pseudorhodoplanes sp.]